jgi:hypothetical protein
MVEMFVISSPQPMWPRAGSDHLAKAPAGPESCLVPVPWAQVTERLQSHLEHLPFSLSIQQILAERWLLVPSSVENVGIAEETVQTVNNEHGC